jgi:hypothetical protein
VIIRDHHEAFLGSQSLRKVELEKRREVGIVVRHPAVVHELLTTFEEDWALTDSGKRARAKERGDHDRHERSAGRDAQAQA